MRSSLGLRASYDLEMCIYSYTLYNDSLARCANKSFLPVDCSNEMCDKTQHKTCLCVYNVSRTSCGWLYIYVSQSASRSALYDVEVLLRKKTWICMELRMRRWSHNDDVRHVQKTWCEHAHYHHRHHHISHTHIPILDSLALPPVCRYISPRVTLAIELFMATRLVGLGRLRSALYVCVHSV